MHPVTPAPQYLIDRVGAAKPRRRSGTFDFSKINQDHAEIRAVEYLNNLAPVAKGSRNSSAFNSACKLRDFGCAEKLAIQVMIEHFPAEPPLDRAELETTIRSAYHGERENDPGCDAPELIFSEVPVQKAKDRKLSFRRYDEIIPDLTRPALVQGLLTPSSVSLIYAESNHGKSWFAIELAHAVAAGIPFLGCEVEKCPVVYVVAEGVAGFKKRIAAYQKRRGFRSIPLFMIEDSLDLLHNAKADTKALIETVQDIGKEVSPVGLVVIDTLARVAGSGDENSAEDMGRFNERIAEIVRETGAHVSIIHHSGKDGSRGARGSSALRAAVDTEAKVEKSENQIFTITVTKQRDQEFISPIHFKLEPVVIGKNSKGEIVESCVVVPSDPPRLPVKLNKVAKRALESFESVERTQAEVNSQGCVTILESAWRDAFKSQHYPESARQTVSDAWANATRELISKGLVIIDGGTAWKLKPSN